MKWSSLFKLSLTGSSNNRYASSVCLPLLHLQQGLAVQTNGEGNNLVLRSFASKWVQDSGQGLRGVGGGSENLCLNSHLLCNFNLAVQAIGRGIYIIHKGKYHTYNKCFFSWIIGTWHIIINAVRTKKKFLQLSDLNYLLICSTHHVRVSSNWIRI